MGEKTREVVGTPVYDNWRAFLSGEPRLGGYEYVLYSDAWITGEVSTGVEPYAFFNLVPFVRERGEVQTVVAVRAWIHVSLNVPSMEKTDPSRYHGGNAADELAALASLACGVRFRAGNETRRFDTGQDSLGRPVAWGNRPYPVLSRNNYGFVLPRVTGERSMMPLARLSSFPKLQPAEAITLVRSARQYQDALWLSESEPNLSWLLLVTAVETAASMWRNSSDPPLDRMKASRPDFVAALETMGGAELATLVANEFAPSIGATKKFVDFLCTFSPGPPNVRPADWGQADWSPSGLRRTFSQIYDYRSRALHDGMPFPAPMSEAPYRHETWETYAEKPIGMAASVGGGTWLAKDTPMVLQTFEQIVQHVLLAWWESLVPVDAN
jgi:hypothetical protein